MVSQEIRDRFAALLYKYADCEGKTEVTRQVLLEKPDFAAYAAFRAITDESQGGITYGDLKAFLIQNGVKTDPFKLDALMLHLDIDQDNVINWKEFLDLILSREIHKVYDYGDLQPVSTEVEYSLVRILEQEMDNEMTLEPFRRAVWDSPGLDEEALFNALDAYKKTWISVQDVNEYLAAHIPDHTIGASERCFMRIDENNSNRISLKEFTKIIRPLYTYKKVEHFVPQRKDLTPDHLVYPTHYPHALKPTLAVDTKVSQPEDLTVTVDADGERKQVAVETDILESPGRRIKVARPQSEMRPAERHRNDDPLTTRVRYNDQHWMLDHPAYYYNHSYGYPFGYEDDHWKNHPYHAHRRRLEELEKMNPKEVEVIKNPPKGKTIKQRNKQVAENKKKGPVKPQKRYKSPEKRAPHKRDDIIDTKSAKKHPEPCVALVKPDTDDNDDKFHDTIYQMRPKGETSNTNRAALLRNMQKCLDDIRICEEKRIHLANQFDFCIEELFNQFDNHNTGYLNIEQ